MKITGNTILITGATSGIGLAFAEEFSRLGNVVIICGRREERLDKIKQQHPSLVTKVLDVSNPSQCKELADWATNNFPELNVVINNAGVQFAFDLNKPVDMDKVNAEVQTNFIAPIQLSSLFVKHLSGKDNAAIINISSGLAFVPIAFMPVYCATKAAIHSFTVSLRFQLRKTNIKVFEVAPPSVDTELGHDRREDKSQSHGGMPIHTFLTEAVKAIEDDIYEAPIADAKHLKDKGMDMFEIMNGRFN